MGGTTGTYLRQGPRAGGHENPGGDFLADFLNVGMLMLATVCWWWIGILFDIVVVDLFFCVGTDEHFQEMRQIKDARLAGPRQNLTVKSLRRHELCQSLGFWKPSW